MNRLIGHKYRKIAAILVIVLCSLSVAGLAYSSVPTEHGSVTVNVQKGTTVEKTFFVRNHLEYRLEGYLTVANAACGNRCPHMEVIGGNDIDIPRGGLLLFQVKISSHVENDCGECTLTVFCVKASEPATSLNADVVEVLDVNIIVQEGEVRDDDNWIVISLLPLTVAGAAIGTIVIYFCRRGKNIRRDVDDAGVPDG